MSRVYTRRRLFSPARQARLLPASADEKAVRLPYLSGSKGVYVMGNPSKGLNALLLKVLKFQLFDKGI